MGNSVSKLDVLERRDDSALGKVRRRKADRVASDRGPLLTADGDARRKLLAAGCPRTDREPPRRRGVRPRCGHGDVGNDAVRAANRGCDGEREPAVPAENKK